MPESPLFTDLDESPLFVTRTGELEADLGRLSERVAKFVSGARKYTSHLENAHDVTLQFASSLQEFCGGTDGTDEESMALGTMGRGLERNGLAQRRSRASRPIDRA